MCRLCGQYERIYIDVFGEEGIKRYLGLKIHKKINILVSRRARRARTLCSALPLSPAPCYGVRKKCPRERKGERERSPSSSPLRFFPPRPPLTLPFSRQNSMHLCAVRLSFAAQSFTRFMFIDEGGNYYFFFQSRSTLFGQLNWSLIIDID